MDIAGVVGVGSMGTVIVEHLLAAGLKVVAYDVSTTALERAAALGAKPCASPAEVGGAADIVSVMVLDDQQTLDCVLGSHGVLEGLSPGNILLLHNTISPSTTRQIAQAAQGRGVGVADACISARTDAFRAGESATIVGGDPEILERVRPYLEHLGKAILYMGPVGSGNVAKIMENLIILSQRVVRQEVLQIGESAGIPSARALELLVWTLATPAEAIDGPTPPLRAPGGGYVGSLFGRILPAALELADEFKLEIPVTRRIASGGNPYA